MNHTRFGVTRFENRNGAVSWRVCGWLHGVRIRRNFKTREEAAAEKAALELKALQGASGVRAAATFLTDGQLREAEASFRRIADRGRSLTFYLDYALANHREPERDVALGVAVEEYVATKRKEHERRLLSIRQFDSIRNELEALKRHFPAEVVSQFAPPCLIAYNSRLDVLKPHTQFEWLSSRQWLLRSDDSIPGRLRSVCWSYGVVVESTIFQPESICTRRFRRTAPNSPVFELRSIE